MIIKKLKIIMKIMILHHKIIIIKILNQNVTKNLNRIWIIIIILKTEKMKRIIIKIILKIKMKIVMKMK